MPSDFDAAALRRHSYAVGTIARLLTHRCHALPKTSQRISFSGTMFAAGLLHDIGKVLMTGYVADKIADVPDKIYADGIHMVDAETKILGISHTDAGLYAGMEWKFPVLLINVIGRHHWPLEQIIPRLKTRQGRLAQRVIRIADAASYAMGYGMLRSEGPPRGRAGTLQKNRHHQGGLRQVGTRNPRRYRLHL